MYTYIYKKNIYVHGRVCNNNMYAWGKCGGKYNNMREGALRSATDPKEKKKEVVNMYVKSSGLTDGGRRKRRRA